MRSFYVLLLLFSTSFLSATSLCQTDKYYIIRNQPSGLVLEANGNDVSLQFYTGYDAQLWKFDCNGPPGVFNILNKHLLPALDVEQIGKETAVVLNKRDLKSDSQNWILNADGTFYNVDTKLYLDIVVEGVDGKVEVGSTLNVVPLSGDENQKFLLQQKS